MHGIGKWAAQLCSYAVIEYDGRCIWFLGISQVKLQRIVDSIIHEATGEAVRNRRPCCECPLRINIGVKVYAAVLKISEVICGVGVDHG